MDKPNKVKKFTAQGSRSLKPVGVASGSSADSHRRLSCNWESNDGEGWSQEHCRSTKVTRDHLYGNSDADTDNSYSRGGQVRKY